MKYVLGIELPFKNISFKEYLQYIQSGKVVTVKNIGMAKKFNSAYDASLYIRTNQMEEEQFTLEEVSK